MEYRHGSHTVYNIEYHFVWITKYRYHVLVGELKTRTREIVRQICLQHELNLLKGHVSKDHVHLWVSAPPIWLPVSYWGQPIWSRGYFCATVGQVTDEMIRQYIEGHVDKSPDENFTLDTD